MAGNLSDIERVVLRELRNWIDDKGRVGISLNVPIPWLFAGLLVLRGKDRWDEATYTDMWHALTRLEARGLVRMGGFGFYGAASRDLPGGHRLESVQRSGTPKDYGSQVPERYQRTGKPLTWVDTVLDGQVILREPTFSGLAFNTYTLTAGGLAETDEGEAAVATAKGKRRRKSRRLPRMVLTQKQSVALEEHQRGISLSEIGRGMGVTKEAARRLVNRAKAVAERAATSGQSAMAYSAEGDDDAPPDYGETGTDRVSKNLSRKGKRNDPRAKARQNPNRRRYLT